MPPGATDTANEVFATRLASLLHIARTDRGTSLREMARATAGAATGRQLRAIEAAEADLRRFDVAEIAAAYGIDPCSLFGERLPLEVDLEGGVVQTAGSARGFTPGDTDALLLAYLLLIRDVRDLPQDAAVVVRRDDVEVLARHLEAEAATVIDRLAGLMGATGAERRSTVGLFAAGAAVLVLTMSAVATPTTRPSSSSSEGDIRPSRDLRASASPVSSMTPPPPPPPGTSSRPSTGDPTFSSWA